MKLTNLTAAAAGALAATVLAGGIAWSAIGDGGVIQGCYDAGGNLKVVSMLPCPKSYTPLQWNQQGMKGDKGDKGETGQQGPQGPTGTLASLEALNGRACNRNGQAGAAQIAYDATGVATITCVVSGGGGGEGVPPDAINNTCAASVNLGLFFSGLHSARSGTTSPAGTEDWFRVSLVEGLRVQVTLTGDPGIKFDIVGPCGSTVESGLTSAQVSAPNPFSIRVYGDANVTGSWTLAISPPPP